LAIVCAVEGCKESRRKREWCGRHYSAWRRHGDPTVAKYTWAPRASSCIACGTSPLMAGSREFCSRACQQAAYRARLGGNDLEESIPCRSCGDPIDVSRHEGRRIRRGRTAMCADCFSQRQKHGVPAKMLARRDGYVCKACGKTVDLDIPAPNPLSPTIDRIIPRARGGSNDLNNLQLVHRVCNQVKGDLLPDEILIRHCTMPGCSRPLCNRAMGLCLDHMRPYYRRQLTLPADKRGRRAYARTASSCL
jgi:5-methylcytosine-specific restriction endonuclease McrA